MAHFSRILEDQSTKNVSSISSKKEEQTIPAMVKVVGVLAGSALLIGVTSVVVEVVMGAGTLAAIFSTIGGALSSAFTALASLGTLIVLNPAFAIAILGSVILAVAVIVILSFAIKKKIHTTKILELVEKLHSGEYVKRELVDRLCKSAAQGKTHDFTQFFKERDGKHIGRLILFDKDESGKSAMTPLAEQHFSSDTFDKNNKMHRLILEGSIVLDEETEVASETQRFFELFAKINFNLAKSCLEECLETKVRVELGCSYDTPIGRILMNITQAEFLTSNASAKFKPATPLHSENKKR